MERYDTTYNFIVVLCACLIQCLVIYYLWNWIVPSIFYLRKISMLESGGIFILFNILFGSIHKGGMDGN